MGRQKFGRDFLKNRQIYYSLWGVLGRLGWHRKWNPAIETNRSTNNPVLVIAKFILSVLALAVHLALSYPERPA